MNDGRLDLDLDAAMAALSERRPVFHSEADFQHALAWLLQERFPNARIRLEYRAPHQPQRGYVDIWASGGAEHIGIELKYKTRAIKTTVGDEDFDLLNQAAQDIGRYDTLKDIQRLERVVAAIPSSRGFVVLLTNDSSYWMAGRDATVDAAFRLYEGRTLEGSLSWSERASAGTRRSREAPLSFDGRYECAWRPYSTVRSPRFGAFRYLLVPIAPRPKEQTGTEADTWRLEVSGEDLLRAFLVLRHASSRGDLVVSFQDGRLRLARGSVFAEVPATGTWPSTARGPFKISKYLPRFQKGMVGRLIVSGTRHMVHLGHFSMPCHWTPYAPESTNRE